MNEQMDIPTDEIEYISDITSAINQEREDAYIRNAEKYESEQQEKNESMGPREFVKSIETLAQLKIEYLNELYNLYFEHDAIEIRGAQVLFKPGMIEDDLVVEQWKLLNEKCTKLDDMPLRPNSRTFVDGQVDLLNKAIFNKRELINRFETKEYVDSNIGGLSEIDRNRFIAGELFKTLHPAIEPPSNLNYIEAPLGIIFTTDNINELNRIWKDATPDQYRGDFSENAPDARAFFTVSHCTLPGLNNDGDHEYYVGTSFILNEGHEGDKISTSLIAYKHEEQHLLDCLVFYTLDRARATHKRQNADPEKLMYVQKALSMASMFSLKSEIFAMETLDTFKYGIASTYLCLTNPYTYNYEGIKTALQKDNSKPDNIISKILKTTLEKIKSKTNVTINEEKKLAEEYNQFVGDSTGAFQTLNIFYNEEFCF